MRVVKKPLSTRRAERLPGQRAPTRNDSIEPPGLRSREVNRAVACVPAFPQRLLVIWIASEECGRFVNRGAAILPPICYLGRRGPLSTRSEQYESDCSAVSPNDH